MCLTHLGEVLTAQKRYKGGDPLSDLIITNGRKAVDSIIRLHLKQFHPLHKLRRQAPFIIAPCQSTFLFSGCILHPRQRRYRPYYRSITCRQGLSLRGAIPTQLTVEGCSSSDHHILAKRARCNPGGAASTLATSMKWSFNCKMAVVISSATYLPGAMSDGIGARPGYVHKTGTMPATPMSSGGRLAGGRML